MFENDVKTYGTETEEVAVMARREFENDVKTYGTETGSGGALQIGVFENDVKTYGTETFIVIVRFCGCLRMM